MDQRHAKQPEYLQQQQKQQQQQHQHQHRHRHHEVHQRYDSLPFNGQMPSQPLTPTLYPSPSLSTVPRAQSQAQPQPQPITTTTITTTKAQTQPRHRHISEISRPATPPTLTRLSSLLDPISAVIVASSASASSNPLVVGKNAGKDAGCGDDVMT